VTKEVAVNRQAFHNYEILERLEAGIVLTGTEIKSARDGRVNLKDAYGLVKSGEVWLLNCHISPYSHGNYANHDPLRTRKLLLNRSEIRKLIGRTTEKGLTLVPLRLYLKNGRLKCELALAKGRKLHDKREVSRMKTIEKEARQAVCNLPNWSV
jgi:SsrA-binding protein